MLFVIENTTHNLGTQYYTFLISHSWHKRNGIETQIIAINVKSIRKAHHY